MTITQGRTIDDPFRVGKAYTAGEAARLARTTSATVRRWLLGYDAPGHHMDPVFGGRSETKEPVLLVSFLELVELTVAARFRFDDRLPLERLRRAHDFARRELKVEYPFASLKFKLEGGHVMHRFEEESPGVGEMAFDMHGQWALPGLVLETLSSLDFEAKDELAVRLFPFGKEANIVIDPHLAAGRPVIGGTRVPVTSIWERFESGESIQTLCDTYDLESSVVEEVIRLRAA